MVKKAMSNNGPSAQNQLFVERAQLFPDFVTLLALFWSNVVRLLS